MNILIIEDERFAQEKLRGLISEYITEGKVVNVLCSIEESIEYLRDNSPQPDLIFMDVELSDGLCFEIFKHISVTSKIIITTAYDQYALNAFKIGSIDYLLKPIDPIDFKQSIDRIVKTQPTNAEQPNYSELLNILRGETKRKKRFTVRIGDRILIIETNNIAYFMSEDKFTYIVTNDSHKYITDLTLDGVEDLVDGKRFFRLSRGCLASIESIKSVTKHLNGRLKVDLIPHGHISEAAVVSRQRSPQFIEWLEG